MRTNTSHIESHHQTSPPVYDDTFETFAKNKIIYIEIQITTTNQTPNDKLSDISTNISHLESYHRTSPSVYDDTLEQ